MFKLSQTRRIEAQKAYCNTPYGQFVLEILDENEIGIEGKTELDGVYTAFELGTDYGLNSVQRSYYDYLMSYFKDKL